MAKKKSNSYYFNNVNFYYMMILIWLNDLFFYKIIKYYKFVFENIKENLIFLIFNQFHEIF